MNRKNYFANLNIYPTFLLFSIHQSTLANILEADQ
jgi:hypothetical protein